MTPTRTWTLLLLASAVAAGCSGDESAPAPAPHFAPEDRARFVDAAILAAMPDPKVVDDPRLRALLGPSPDAASLAWFSDDVLFAPDDARLLSILMALVGSKNAEVARMSADMVAGAYVVAASDGVDVGPAVDLALKSPSAATRRLVVRSLGLPECAPVRAWLHAHENDDGADEADPAHPTVASEVRAALKRLNDAAAQARSIAPTDPLVAVECNVDGSEHMPAPGAESTLEIGVSRILVGTHTRSVSSPPEPVVDARIALQMQNGIAILENRKQDAPIFSFGLYSTPAMYLVAWSRPVSKTRVRFWFRCSPPGAGK
jgi:hypothetical protein